MQVKINYNLKPVKHPVEIKHKNYLEYLSICWASHYGAVISPDILWHIVLCEIATEVAKNPETYRHLFSDSEEKQEISVSTDSLIELPLDSVLDVLRQKTKISPDLFLPKFSTTGEMESLAFSAAFCDLVSPYYDYCMFCCGIPYISVYGKSEDYRLAVDTIDKLIPYFTSFSEVNQWLVNVSYIFHRIEFLLSHSYESGFDKFFNLEKCGSGSQVEVSGWIEFLFLNKPKVKFVENYNTCVSKVKYKNLSTGKNYEMTVSLSGSVLDGDLLIPNFVKNIEEISI